MKPNFFRSLTVTALPIAARLTFIGLWTYADDEGRALDDMRLIKAEVWPLDDDCTTEVIESHMKAIAKAGLITRYKVGTRRYFAITSWTEHQKVNRPQESSLPDPCALTDQSLNDHGRITAGLGKGKVKEEDARSATGRVNAPVPFAADFDELWSVYPRKVDRGRAYKAYVARRRAGASHGDLLMAAQNYAKAVEGQDPNFTKYGKTFLGPDDSFREWVIGPPEGASTNGSSPGFTNPRLS